MDGIRHKAEGNTGIPPGGRSVQKAGALKAAPSADEAPVAWLRNAGVYVRIYSGVVTLMAAAPSDTSSALHTSCANLRSAGTRLLTRAQATGTTDQNMTGSDMFALIGALGWMGDQAAYSARSDYLFDVIAGAILTKRPPGGGRVTGASSPYRAS